MKNKHYLKDLDLIHEDLKPENKSKLENQNIDEDLPGLGQYYCIDCAKYFVNLQTLNDHLKTKTHKRQLKKLKEPIYTIQDSIN